MRKQAGYIIHFPRDSEDHRIMAKKKNAKSSKVWIVIVGLIIVGGFFGSLNKSSSTQNKTNDIPEVTQLETEPATEASSEPVTEEPSEMPKEFSNEDLIRFAQSHDMTWQLGPRDKILGANIEDGVLTISVQLSANDTVISRFSGMTKVLLALEEGYNLWHTITIDFGSCGVVTKTKDDVIIENGEKLFHVEKADIIKQ